MVIALGAVLLVAAAFVAAIVILDFEFDVLSTWEDDDDDWN